MHKIIIAKQMDTEYKSNLNSSIPALVQKLHRPAAFVAVLLPVIFTATLVPNLRTVSIIVLLAYSTAFNFLFSKRRPQCATMNSSITLAFGFALVLVLCVSFTQGAVGPRCAPSDDYSEPHDCPYGKVTDNCGRKVCAKGPGEHCGIGVFQVLGICGEGTFCRCGRCIGCSLHSFECFDKTCLN